MMASSYPALSTSTLARMLLRYWPEALAARARDVWSSDWMLDVLARTPCLMPSSPRYVPHGHAAMITSTGALMGYRPISP